MKMSTAMKMIIRALLLRVWIGPKILATLVSLA
jgi:hypothetical protein